MWLKKLAEASLPRRHMAYVLFRDIALEVTLTGLGLPHAARR